MHVRIGVKGVDHLQVHSCDAVLPTLCQCGDANELAASELGGCNGGSSTWRRSVAPLPGSEAANIK